MLETWEIALIGISVLIVVATIIWAVFKVKSVTMVAKSARQEPKGSGSKQRNNNNNNKKGFLDKKERELRKKEKDVTDRQRIIKQKEKMLDEKKKEFDAIIQKENRILGDMAKMSPKQAKKSLMKNIEKQFETEVHDLKNQMIENARSTAGEEVEHIINESMRKHFEEATEDMKYSVYLLPKTEIKSWVIGSSGRNIRTFESATGAKLVISQFSDAVVISSTDMKKVKMAEVALEELIDYGKITPELILDKVAHLKEEIVEFFDEE